LANQIFFKKDDLPQPLANRLVRLAAFQNPEFYKAQAMRLPVWNKSRIIGCAEEYSQYISLPRGCLDAVLEMLNENDIRPELHDERLSGRKVSAKFVGTLRKDQKAAVREMLKSEVGVFCAPTAFGKTVTAASLIARRKVSTLVLVHRTELTRQWRERLISFLEIPKGCPGVIGGGKKKLSGKIDIAVMQSWPNYLPTPVIPPDSPIQEVFRILTNDVKRNRRIAADVLTAYREGRKVLVLTERTGHLPLLQEALSDEVEHCFVLHGRLSRKQRTAIFAELGHYPSVPEAGIFWLPQNNPPGTRR